MADAPDKPAAAAAVKAVLDAELAQLRAEIAKLTKAGGDPAKLAQLQQRLRRRGLQRARLG